MGKQVDPSPRLEWRLQLAGAPQLRCTDGRTLLLERRDAAMLARLAVEGPMPRVQVLTLLWPEHEPASVRGRLRQRIFTLKRKLGFDALEGQSTLALTSSIEWRGLAEEPDDLPLLGGDAYQDLAAFAHWLGIVRVRLETLRRERLAEQASVHERAGRYAHAIAAAERLLQVEPLHEHAHRRLMRLHYLRGDRAAALMAFKRCDRLLREEVGATPSRETLDLLEQIDGAAATTSASARALSSATAPRSPATIARDAERHRRLELVERVFRSGFLGEADQGRTRLLAHLFAIMGTARVVVVSALAGDDELPYALLGRLLRALLSRPGSAPAASGTIELLAQVLPEFGIATASVSRGAVRQLANAVQSALASARGEGLTAIFLDDLHFADEASVDFMRQLAASGSLIWGLAFRGAELSDASRALVDALASVCATEMICLQVSREGQAHEPLA